MLRPKRGGEQSIPGAKGTIASTRKEYTMETQDRKSPHTLFWIAGIAVTVFSAAGIAAIMGWIPTSTSSPTESVVGVTPPTAAKPAPSALAQEQARDRAREQARVQAREDARAEARARAQVADSTPARWRCAECGVVQSVREIETKGEGSGLGAVGGAVVGGVLGHQVGGGSGQKIATVVGAVGGAVAGNEVEKRVKSGKSYEITVRLEDGSSRVINEATAPSWRPGDRVKVVNGVIQSNA
jgi:outer membrane lipoprotein SlyB